MRIYSDLTFKEHVTSICSKANQKPHSLTRVSKYKGLQKRRNLIKSFITSQFIYCPIGWMCYTRSLTNEVNHVHERTIQIIYQEFQSSFSTFLVKDNSFTIHQKNLQLLAVEVFKARMNISYEITNKIFDFSKNFVYELRRGKCLSRLNIHSTHFGIDSIANIAAKIWNKIRNEKEASSYTVFKSKIKKLDLQSYPYRLCKTYVGQVGFI